MQFDEVAAMHYAWQMMNPAFNLKILGCVWLAVHLPASSVGAQNALLPTAQLPTGGVADTALKARKITDLSEFYPGVPAYVAKKDMSAESLRQLAELRERFLRLKPYNFRLKYADFAELQKQWQAWGWERQSFVVCFPGDKVAEGVSKRDFVNEVVPFMRQLASAYVLEKDGQKRALAAELFCQACQYLLKQGFVHGPDSRISIKDGGYTLRYFAPAVFALREELDKRALLDDMTKAVAWQSMGCEMVKAKPYITCDHFYNFSVNLPLAVLLIKDEAQQYQWMKCVKRFYDSAIALDVPFGKDGSIHHHWGHHLAYGGYAPVNLMKWQLLPLKGSEFAINQASKNKLRAYSVAIAMQAYCGIVAPNLGMRAGVNALLDEVEPAWLCAQIIGGANAADLDQELAGIYLRAQSSAGTAEARRLLQAGFKPASARQHLVLNRPGISVHRREGWSASAASLIKSERSLEIYGWLEFNNYGKSARNASLFLNMGKHNGWDASGWNYNHWPAATNHVLSAGELFEGYAMYSAQKDGTAGVSLHDDGVWGSDFAQQKLTFRKSVAFFDDLLVVQTEGICSTQADKAVITSLFQQSCLQGKNAVVADHLAIDNFGNGYVALDDNKWIYRKGLQQWTYLYRKYLKDAKNNPCLDMRRKKFLHADYQKNEQYYTPTQGEFSTLWIEHGKQPQQASCKYLILMQSAAANLDELAGKAAAAKGDLEFLQCNQEAHVTRRVSSGQTAYAVWKAADNLPGAVRKTNQACRIMLSKNAKGRYDLAVAQSAAGAPNISIVLANGKQLELAANYPLQTVLSDIEL